MNISPERPLEGNLNTRSPHAPRPPPLPAPRPFQGVKNAAYKIIGLQVRPTSPQTVQQEVKATLPGIFNRFTALGANQDATVGHRTGLEINTLSINEKGTHALIGGKEIFKTVKIENGVCVEDRNLRTTIRSTPNQASGETRKVYSIDIADVAWAKGDLGDFVAAATTSGKIILYDLAHASLQGTLLHEHARQVHRVTFNPHRGNLLLSGSQDGTVRLWDARDARSFVSNVSSKRKFAGASDGVRDVKWSPTDGFDFAFSTDSGWIQHWDIRFLHKVPKMKIPAHQSSCNSVDWHPDGKHLVSAGMDKTLRVWDLSTIRKHKPIHEIKTPYAISNARWRPACESSMPQDGGARMCTQIVTAYDRQHSVVHIWDLRRSALPFREFQPYASAPTDLLWHSQDLFWTVGREGIFLQTDVHHTNKVIERRPLQAVAISPVGGMSLAAQKRHQYRPRHASLPKLQTPKSSSLSQSPEYNLLSRSWADESVDNSFLTVEPRRTSHSKSSTRYSSATATPQSGLMPKAMLKLDDILSNRQSMTPRQPSFHGKNPLQNSASTFRAMARTCDAALSKQSGDASLEQHVDTLMQGCLKVAAMHDQQRLAQTLDVVAFAMRRHLTSRLSAGRDALANSTHDTSEISRMIKLALGKSKSAINSPAVSPMSMQTVPSIAQALATTETNSNMTTPLARPIPIARHTSLSYLHTHLPDPEHDHDIKPLPPSLTSPHERRLEQPAQDNRLTHENLQSPQYQKSIPVPIEISGSHVWSPQTKPLLNLEPDTQTKPVRPSLLKHDSGESFSFLVGSQSTQGHSMPTSFESSDGKPASMVKGHPTRPILRVNSQPASLKHEGVNQYDFESPDLEMSPKTTASAHESFADESMAQTLQQSTTLERPATNMQILRLLRSSDIDVEEGEAFKMSEMIEELVLYYAGKSASAQTAAQLLLLLVPLLPTTSMPSRSLVEQVVIAYAEPLSSPDTSELVASIFGWLLSSGLNPLQIESVFTTYHEQLLAYRLFVEAASLRRLAFPAFPAVYEYALGSDSLLLTCGACRKKVSWVNGRLQCDSCSVKQQSCSFCHCDSSPFSGSTSDSLITFCMMCNHSTHSDCAVQWFGELHGHSCPTEGCLCICVV